MVSTNVLKKTAIGGTKANALVRWLQVFLFLLFIVGFFSPLPGKCEMSPIRSLQRYLYSRWTSDQMCLHNEQGTEWWRNHLCPYVLSWKNRPDLSLNNYRSSSNDSETKTHSNTSSCSKNCCNGHVKIGIQCIDRLCQHHSGVIRCISDFHTWQSDSNEHGNCSSFCSHLFDVSSKHSGVRGSQSDDNLNILKVYPLLIFQFLCKLVSILIHFCFTACYMFMMLEALHMYFLVAYIVKKDGPFSRLQNTLIGWVVSAIVVLFCICFEYENYGGKYQ